MPALYLRPGQRYYPAMLAGQVDFLDEIGAVPHTEASLPLGRSRYGGCLLDLPPGVGPLPLDNPRAQTDFPTPAAAEAYRERAGFRFAAHLNFEQLGPLDPTGRLPTSGQLYVYFDGLEDEAAAQYHDVPAATLQRHVVEHEWMFYEGVEIASAYWADEPEAREGGDDEGGFGESGSLTDEDLADDLDGLVEELGVTLEEWEAEMAADAEAAESDEDESDEGDNDSDEDDGYDDDEGWDDDWNEEEDDDEAFRGADESRVFGDFVHVQWGPEERAAASAGKVVLLQIGEGDFNDEGVFSVLVDEDALARRDFSGVTAYWAQT